MKTSFVITIETSKMKNIVCEDHIDGIHLGGSCPETKDLIKEVEQALHQHYFDIVKNLLTDEERVFEEMENTGHEDVLCVEGFDSLSDYGTIKTTIKKVK